jgi:acyl-CoA reductase-like NAD-dependent aldehyde dehydrogenase
MPIAQRADRLRDWRDIVAANEATLIERLVCDVAKPVRDARGELAYALALIDHTISTLADEEPAAQGGPATRYRPLGCVAAITPWNNPLAMPVAKLAPALGYGNAVLLKPAPQGLAIAKLLHDWLGDTGMGDFVRVAPGDAQAGREAVSAVGIRAIAFTGSTRTGRAIIARGGALGRRVQAEMGGNNAAIIAPDADIAAAAADLVPAMFSFAGQRCTAVRRLIVANGIADAFESALQREMERLNMGDPACEDVQVGPVIDTAAASRLRQIRKEALARGGRIAAQARGDEADNFVLPTIIADCGPDDPLVMEEQFGPVCTIQRAADCDAAIALHNAVDQGLLGVLYSHDPRWRDAFAEEARAGMLSYNAARPAFAASGPFSGWGASGFGPPEHGRWNRDFQTRVQAIYDSESA